MHSTLSQTRVFLAQQMIHREFWLQVVIEVILPVSIPLLVWLSLLGSGVTLAEFTSSSMRQYYFFVTIIAILSHTEIQMDLSRLVHEGTLSQWLLRPSSAVSYISSIILSRIVTLALPTVVVGALMVIFDPQIFLGMTPAHLIAMSALIPLAILVACMVNILIALMSFWFVEVEGIFAGTSLILGFFSGMVMPVELLPSIFREIGEWVPYQYVFAAPIRAIIDPGLENVKQALLGQLIWIVILGALLRITWGAGLRRFDAVGN